MDYIPLPRNERLPVIWCDDSVLIVDKPPGWILAPRHWTRTSRNLQRTLELAIEAQAPWVVKHRIHYLRYVHRLDADTSGLLLLARSRSALRALTRLFQTGAVRKLYLAVVDGEVPITWECDLKLRLVSHPRPRAKASKTAGKPALTLFRRLAVYQDHNSRTHSLVAAEPRTGRTHQVRAHLAASGFPVVGDTLYGKRRQALERPARTPHQAHSASRPFGLRAIALQYQDPFHHQLRSVTAPVKEFLLQYNCPPSLINIVQESVKTWLTTPEFSADNEQLPANRQDFHNIDFM